MQLQSMKGEEKVSHVVSKGELLFPLIFASPDEAITVAMWGAQKVSALLSLARRL